MIIEIIEASGKAPGPEQTERAAAVFGRKFDVPADTRVSVICVNDNEMRSFNSQFFGRSDTTDVLSVTIDEEFSDGYLWGEIYISTETAERESEKRAVSWEEEALLYIIHGLLHLAGFEDTSEKDRRNMWDIQMDILEQCGLFRESFVEDQ